ncbi:MAG: IS481 family transposase [Pseudonocardia sp.]|uniref:IS481 family transposase n=1 Tax=Pseudonocardia sp. TaxID=60912 RepID=UPI001ACF7A51|nr:IS481 family transposase [Pseudonocardia sp.]MBN9097950.1 IS481 family transposase [Pseudonocardia sp.]
MDEDGSAGTTWLVEHRLRAVLEVRDGAPVTEVAARYGASRQSVYGWKSRYERDGIGGLADRSRRPHTSPGRMPAQVEALVCELRRTHPRWGARRIVFELATRGVDGVPARATVHRALVRNGLVEPQQQRHRRKYKRWQREAPMHLWQMDLVGGIYLANGRECKMVTGIDDHSRYVVVAAVVAVPNGRAVCDAFAAAMADHGIPSEVLTDNGKQFTGRFTKPRPAEVLFERICRENGITARLTKPRSPTTTGKIERWHQTLRRELLDHCGPFADLPAAQAAIDAWVHSYNHNRPHQSLDMATPASLFRPARSSTVSGLPAPAASRTGRGDATGDGHRPTHTAAAVVGVAAGAGSAPEVIVAVSSNAVEFDTVIAASGVLNVLPRVQRVRMSTTDAGRLAHVWADEHSIHILLGAQLVKTVASNLAPADLAELRMRGAAPAGPPPSSAVARNGRLPAGAVIEIDRAVDRDGSLTLAATRLVLGTQLARTRVTLRLDGHLIHVIHDGVLAKTLPCPVPPEQRHRLRGARLAEQALPPPPAGPVHLERRVPVDGVVMVTRQRLRVGRTHAGKTVTIIVEDTHFRVLHNGEELSLHPRTTTQPVTRFRAYAPRQPGE